MNEKTYTTTEILKTLQVPFWRLEHLVRAGRVVPLNRGRGTERLFAEREYQKVKKIFADRDSVIGQRLQSER